ncbi:MAG TPA: cytochrome b/b6 domain-containing protein [Woeseiaceae bacterium]|nr:cytochrome b/b6 domain-containing protein [Woeseiaceae bacterium]
MKTTHDMTTIWDPIVRIGHWTLVIAFFTAYFTEDDFLAQHVWAGYVVGTVIAIRVIWGLVGTKHARFSDFVRSPAVILRYVGDLKASRAERFVGHNPAGGAMVIALLVCITITVTSGLVLYAIEEDAGPLAGWVADSTASSTGLVLIANARADEDGRANDDREEFWEEVHEIFANLALFLVVLHIAGVLFSSFVHKENLVKAMITGRKRRA